MMTDRRASTEEREREVISLLVSQERWLAALLGLALLALGAYLVAGRFPTAYEWTAYGAQAKTTRSVSDLSGIVTTLTIAGVALIVYGVNGVRLIKFGAGPFTFEAPPPPEVRSTTKQELAEVPGALPGSHVAVPVQVIADAIAAWPPEAGDPPTDLNQFVSASHREGQGSHPWFLKFKDRPVVRVYYGGRGRREPHVSRPEPG